MNCRKCHGTGWLYVQPTGPRTAIRMLEEAHVRPCRAEGCHNGQTHCCDGENVDLATPSAPDKE